MRDFILGQLHHVFHRGEIKVAGNNILIKCPFHKERLGKEDLDPSLSIHTSGNMFFCFGCGARGNWNDIAERLGLEKITELKKYEMSPFTSVLHKMNRLMNGVKQELPNTTFDVRKRWRRMSAKFLRRYGVQLWFDETDDIMRVLFPLYVVKDRKAGKKELYGWTARVMDDSHLDGREDAKKIERYKTSPGSDIKRIMYPETLFMKKSFRTIALAEGPVDSLFLNYCKIPTQSIQGVQNFRENKSPIRIQTHKVNKLVRFGVKNVLIIMDGNEAGRYAAERIYRDLSKAFNVSVFNTPDGLDPNTLKRRHIAQIKMLMGI